MLSFIGMLVSEHGPAPSAGVHNTVKGVAFHESLLSRLLGISLASFASGKLHFSQSIVGAKTM